MPVNKEIKKITTHTLHKMKEAGVPISMITAYDYSFAGIFDAAGIDIILVGDSASNVMAGHETTLPITLDQMIYHASSGEEVIEAVNRIVAAGIPVMGHLGLTPQSIYKFGTYSVRAKEEEEANKLRKDALLLEKAGCFAVVLEKIPASLAKEVSQSLSIPTIGIGAGNVCDGQVLVMHDMLGINTEFKPRFLRQYLNLHEQITGAVQHYIKDVKSREFPNETEQY
ncbi:MAG: 3-methyl-2-oxobutanoate hydroxymethyltransferase [Chitinophagaceae bacterium]|nr:3-methyl-2-oxobutanoate hydroxymethyltransferase [Chitinophagaceae bacterium]